MNESSTPSPTPVRRGRPRVAGPRRAGATVADEILDAAAELFTTRGYAATSTRAIGEAAGMRQASLYHYFPSKESMLTALLDTTVRSSLDLARRLASDDGPAVDRLAELARFDATLLLTSRWNLGALYLLPILRDDEFAEFRDARDELAAIYRGLAVEAIGREDLRALLPFRLVESVIGMRTDEVVTADSDPEAVVDAVLQGVRATVGQA